MAFDLDDLDPRQRSRSQNLDANEHRGPKEYIAVLKPRSSASRKSSRPAESRLGAGLVLQEVSLDVA